MPTFPWNAATLAAASLSFALCCHAQDDYQDFSVPNLPGKLYAPTSTENLPRPLILGLHGGGGIGSDNTRHLVDFNGLLQQAKTRSLFLYLPQAQTTYWHSSDRAAAIIAQIDKAIAEKNVDPNRIYITGFSMGGGGTWDLLNLYPNRFAAAIPICGIAPRSGSITENVSKIPTWAFHARNDSSVSVATTRSIVSDLVRSHQSPAPTYPDSGDFYYLNSHAPIRYTEYATGGHTIWNAVWNSDPIYDWLLLQQSPALSPVRLTNAQVSFSPASQSWTLRFQTDSTAQPVLQQSADLHSWIDVAVETDSSGNQHIPIESPAIFIRARQVP